MTTTKLIGSVAVVFAVFTGAYFFISPIATRFLDEQFAEEMKETEQPSQDAATTSDSGIAATTTTNVDIAVPVSQPATPTPTTPKPVPPTPVTPTPVTPTPVTPTPAAPGYTKEEVAAHASESSCWSIVNGDVYDLTSYISKHPGGSRNVLKICGRDGTSAFEGQHGGESRPERTLEGYKIGPLK
jgi:predicted heme/steroid binding protein